jgi:hypothetical protein
VKQYVYHHVFIKCSAVRRPPSVVRRPPSVVRRPPSAVRRPSSVVRRPPSAVRRPSSAVRPPFIYTHTKDDLTGQSSGNSTAYCKQLTCMDVNTDSDDVLYKSKLNIDGLKTCERRSSLKLKVVSSAHVAFRNCVSFTVWLEFFVD